VPLNALVVGKILSKGDGDSGFMMPATLGAALARARDELGWNAGVGAWQWSAADAPAWIAAVLPHQPHARRAPWMQPLAAPMP
jgi:hypothetical protein